MLRFLKPRYCDRRIQRFRAGWAARDPHAVLDAMSENARIKPDLHCRVVAPLVVARSLFGGNGHPNALERAVSSPHAQPLFRRRDARSTSPPAAVIVGTLRRMQA